MIYCAEEIDNGAGLNGLLITDELTEADVRPLGDLGDAVAIDLKGKRESWPDWDGKLYATSRPALEDTTARFVPYHLWDNRAPGEMLVWIRALR